MPTTPDVLGAVVAALARVLEREPAQITPDLSLAELGADSLVRVELAELVEDALGGLVQISDEELDAAPTVGALAACFTPTGRPAAGQPTAPHQSDSSATRTTSIGGDG